MENHDSSDTHGENEFGRGSLNWLLHARYVRGEHASCLDLTDQLQKQFDNKHRYAHYIKGSVLADAGRLQEALERYHSCIRLQPHDPEPLKQVAKCLMEAKSLIQRGNTLQVKLGVTNYNTPFATKSSPEYVISGSAVFQVRVVAAQVNNGHTNVYNNLVFIRFVKLRPDDDLTYNIKFTSTEFGITNKCLTSDDGTWHLVYENKKQQYTFDITVQMDVVPSASSFSTLHEDMELTDFELRGEDGSVHIHKVVLAASSPVLRRMLGGTWRETTEGHVDVPGTSKKTLQHLKNYVYLHTLPDEDLEQLLLLSSYYMMPDLEQRCVDRLVNSLTAQNACDLLEFAAKHKVTRLLLAVLECVQNRAIDVNEMRDHFMRGK